MRRASVRRSTRGFTLIELIVVLAVLGLITALAMPMFAGALPGARLKAAARDLGAELRYARAQAIAGNRETTLTIDLAARRYAILGARTGPGESRALPEELEIKVRTARRELAGDARASIRFFPDGGSTGGRITLSRGERRYLVGVDWLTGRVTVVNGDDVDDDE